QRYGQPLSVAILDFDHFKSLNDSFGHQTGDAALKLFASKAQRLGRASDAYSRWGGEEFLAVLPNTSAGNAEAVLQRVADSVRDEGFTALKQSVALTLSIGLTECASDDTLESILHRADKAMYDAKAAGRNRIRML
uniref:GGDEF domain-containing protein n=1 Tax=Pseudomaricurvus sp. TaxID=2004510 RepID=UPI003F6C5FF1